MIYYAIF